MNKLWKTTQNQHRVKVWCVPHLLWRSKRSVAHLPVKQYRENNANTRYCITVKTCG